MSTNIKINNYRIMADQYLTDVLPVIPSNVILDKTITGCGATTAEIKADRHSIIVIPNLPGIHSKINDPEYAKYNLFGVFEGKKAPHILQYLENTIGDGKHIKILTTPESFSRVVAALNHVSIDITRGCFLLLDESQNPVKDCDYRKGITIPMDIFFKCQNKAMVSATPIISLSDPRFLDFEILKIVPEYDYKKDLTLYTTNNILQVASEEIIELKKASNSLFIFFNSTDKIYAYMKELALLEESAVFCAAKSVDKLNDLNFYNAYTEWRPDRMKKINWLTSRSYSSFDIKLDVQPNILLITDVNSTIYTMFDPYTDSIQAVGRFRNGVSSITHISNWSNDFPLRNRDSLYNTINIYKDDYYRKVALFENAVSKPEKDALYEILNTHPFKRYINEWGQTDYFLIDNYVNDEMTKSAYHGWRELEMAYRDTGHFNIKHYVRVFPYGDIERIQLEDKSIKIKEKMKIMIKILDALGSAETQMAMEFKRDLFSKDETLVKAYDLLGAKRIEELDYTRYKVEREVIIEENKKKASASNVVKLVHKSFVIGWRYSSNQVKNILKEIYDDLSVPTPPAVTAKTIMKYFEVNVNHTNKGDVYVPLRRIP